MGLLQIRSNTQPQFLNFRTVISGSDIIGFIWPIVGYSSKPSALDDLLDLSADFAPSLSSMQTSYAKGESPVKPVQTSDYSAHNFFETGSEPLGLMDGNQHNLSSMPDIMTSNSYQSDRPVDLVPSTSASFSSLIANTPCQTKSIEDNISVSSAWRGSLPFEAATSAGSLKPEKMASLQSESSSHSSGDKGLIGLSANSGLNIDPSANLMSDFLGLDSPPVMPVLSTQNDSQALLLSDPYGPLDTAIPLPEGIRLCGPGSLPNETASQDSHENSPVQSLEPIQTSLCSVESSQDPVHSIDMKQCSLHSTGPTQTAIQTLEGACSTAALTPTHEICTPGSNNVTNPVQKMPGDQSAMCGNVQYTRAIEVVKYLFGGLFP